MKRTIRFGVAGIVMAFLAAVTHPQAAAAAAAAGETGTAPVELTFVGIDSPKLVFRYRIKVMTDKPVQQVDILAKYVGGDGKPLSDLTHAWQNIVSMKRQPIEKGKTYDAEAYLLPGAARVECKLLRVIYKDGTRWNAPH